MRPSSSRSDGAGPPPPPLLAGLTAGPDVDALLDDTALLRAMLDVESALAGALADCGLAPRSVADALEEACERPDRLDLSGLVEGTASAGNPVVPLVSAIGTAVPPDARTWVHYGATSQDVLDTALMLLVSRCHATLDAAFRTAGDAAASLALTHRDTLAVARTLGQQASPTTFGLVAAGWLSQLDTARARWALVAGDLPVQLGGAVGTRAAYGTQGEAVAAALASRLELTTRSPWHTDRQPILDVAAALGAAVVACGKVATDVLLLAQTELGEVAEASGGGSSAMPHKQNPVSAVLVSAAARRGPALVGSLFGSAVHEQQRATGAWHAEWEPLRDLLRLALGAAQRTADLLEGLQVFPDRMREHLRGGGAVVMAESVATRLLPSLGRAQAQYLVAQAARSRDFEAALRADPYVLDALGDSGISDALDPRQWLGTSGELVDAAVARHQRLGAP
ncbi:3-carboxy-cis,cis-muconate cycloisomerase [Angustibacter luteus]|uniref:3-carboxy-cis,cis-muconate cycloisomerase n=1 Tax=Angustibacter luteus TaxID=658456 RepID=A0ABW1JIA2_9ACTN